MRVLNGFRWFWSLGGAQRGGGPPFNAQNEEGSADSSKTEGTPPGRVFWGSFLGPQMWHILMVFTMRSRDPNGGPNFVALGSLLPCLGCPRGPKRVVLRAPEGPFFGI